jgi:hypothetical protein
MRAARETKGFLAPPSPACPNERPLAHLVFTQVDSDAFPVEQVRTHATKYFGGGFEAAPGGPAFAVQPPADVVLVLFTVRGTSATFSVGVRRVTPEDLAAASRAEARGNAFGMAALAARCSHVWRVSVAGEAPPWLLLECCALLASVALGPILPPDEDTLMGVRSARERAEKLRNLV